MKEIPITVYTPESDLRSPSILARRMWHDLVASPELAWRLMERNIKASYRQSLLGASWVFLPPIATAFLFILFNLEGIIKASCTDLPYSFLVFIGTVLWQLFTDSPNSPLKLVTANKPMLAKINFFRKGLDSVRHG